MFYVCRLTKTVSWYIFQHNPLCCPHNFFISVLGLESHWSKQSSATNMTSLYEIYSPTSESLDFLFIWARDNLTIGFLLKEKPVDFNGMSTRLGLFFLTRGDWISYIVRPYLQFFCFYIQPYRIRILLKQIYLTHRSDPNRYYQCELKWTWM